MSKSQNVEGANSFGGNWSDRTCFDWEMRNGITLQNEGFVKMYQDTARYINDIITFDKFTDLGGGVGAYSKAMRDIGKEVHYYDANIHHHEYASEHWVADRYFYGDFTNMQISGDLIAMIEVAEHIHDYQLLPFLKDIECNYFHFSSTPHRNKMDADWGHINIKQEERWIEVFKMCGFELVHKLNRPTNWSLLFSK